MTIETKRFISRDLFASNESLLFDSAEAECLGYGRHPLAALTFVAESFDHNTSLENLCKECAVNAAEVIFKGAKFKKQIWHCWLYVTTRAWNSTRIRKLSDSAWKLRDDAAVLTQLTSISDDFLFTTQDETRHVTMFEVREEDFAEAAEFCRRDKGSFLMLTKCSGALSERQVRDLFDSAFSRDLRGKLQPSIYWLSLVLALTARGDAAVRVSGEFDDTDVAIDIIGSESFQDI